MEFWYIKTLIRENNSSCSADPRPRSGRPHILYATADINKVKDLTLILFAVSLAH